MVAVRPRDWCEEEECLGVNEEGFSLAETGAKGVCASSPSPPLSGSDESNVEARWRIIMGGRPMDEQRNGL